MQTLAGAADAAKESVQQSVLIQTNEVSHFEHVCLHCTLVDNQFKNCKKKTSQKCLPFYANIAEKRITLCICSKLHIFVESEKFFYRFKQ